MFKRKTQFFACMVTCALLGVSTLTIAQRKKKNAAPVAAPVADSTKKKDPPKIKPYSEVITKEMQTSTGFIKVHSKEDKYFFEIPVSIFNRDIMIVSRISKASADMRNGPNGYAGDLIGETVYTFEKGPRNKVFIRRISFSEYAKDSSISIYSGLQKNNIQAIAEAFPVLAYSPDSSAVVFEATDFLGSDNDIIYFQRPNFKTRAGMGSQINDRSYVKEVRAYPTNVEINAVKTYSAGLNPTGPNYTVELNASMLLLPEKPMQPRFVDSRVGYFAVAHKDYASNPQGVQTEVIARRWRLEPKPEDIEKYKRGELVEPVQPIVFYIDPATPKQWVPYLIKGVNDWQKAFEQAGFKNAIYAREAPTKAEDSTWSIDDARHAAIVYRPSEIANAYGPNVADPRSGEILESHIFWYHNVMQLLQKWYMIQCAAIDPRARKPVFDEALMGDLIRFVSSHEVGHALGLLHNFGSSSTTPVENLRNKAWVEAHGHTPSIMDYARFNYVAQPEDNISSAGVYPRIGDYDKWAIEWGYRWRPEYTSGEEERLPLTKIVTDSLKNHRLWFGNEMEPYDPRSQNEDLGDDAVKASTYGIKNLQRIVPKLAAWTAIPGEGTLELQHTYTILFGQYMRYLGHVIKSIGGIYHYDKIAGEPGPAYVSVDYARQKAAMDFLVKQLFNTPMWLNESSITEVLPMNFAIELANVDYEAINGIISRDRMSRLLNQEIKLGKDKTYTLPAMLTDMNKGIFTELYAGKNIDVYRRNLQKTYINRLIEEGFYNETPGVILGDYSFNLNMSDLAVVIKDNLAQLQVLFKKGLQNPALNKETKLHLKDLNDKIKKKFDEKSRSEG